MASTIVSFAGSAAALGTSTSSRRRRSSAPRTARWAPRAASSGDGDEVEHPTRAPLAFLTAAARNFGVALAASAIVVAPSAAFIADGVGAAAAAPVIGDLSSLAANPVQNPRALLRNALPVKNKEIREVQRRLESISDDLRVPGVRFSGVEESVNKSSKIVTNDAAKILAAVSPAKMADGKAALAEIAQQLEEFKIIVAQKDKQEVPVAQQKVLALVGRLEEDMVVGFPFQVPPPYDTAPLLKGRATVEMEIKIKNNVNVDTGVMTIILDGFNAPVTSGNFADLVDRGFYDGMEIQRSDGFVVQSGKPSAKGADGFVDPQTKLERTIPLEIMPEKKDKDGVPVYDFTFEDVGKYRDEPVLPFNAFGTMAMARRESEPNSASSQFFFLLKESELTPSGTNILDGRYAVFAYVIDGVELLREVKAGDVITSVKIVAGAENLVNKSRAPPPAPPPPPPVEALADVEVV